MVRKRKAGGKSQSTQDARAQIRMQILWCCLRAVWTLPFRSTDPICLRCACGIAYFSCELIFWYRSRYLCSISTGSHTESKWLLPAGRIRTKQTQYQEVASLGWCHLQVPKGFRQDTQGWFVWKQSSICGRPNACDDVVVCYIRKENNNPKQAHPCGLYLFFDQPSHSLPVLCPGLGGWPILGQGWNICWGVFVKTTHLWSVETTRLVGVLSSEYIRTHRCHSRHTSGTHASPCDSQWCPRWYQSAVPRCTRRLLFHWHTDHLHKW